MEKIEKNLISNNQNPNNKKHKNLIKASTILEITLEDYHQSRKLYGGEESSGQGARNSNFEKFKQGDEINNADSNNNVSVNNNTNNLNNNQKSKDVNAQLFDEFDDETNNNNSNRGSEGSKPNSINILRNKNNPRVIQNLKQDPQFKNPPKNPQEKITRIKTIIFNYIKERELDM